MGCCHDLVIPATEGESMGSPRLLPDGESVLFSVTTATGATRWDQAQIVAQSLRTGERTLLVEGGSDARYVPTGHLVYALGGVLLAVAFDVDRLEVSGGPVPVVQGVRRSLSGGQWSDTANYGVSDLGTLVYVREEGGLGVLRTLVWVDRSGTETLIQTAAQEYDHPRVSPDGTRLSSLSGSRPRCLAPSESSPVLWSPLECSPVLETVENGPRSTPTRTLPPD